MRTAFAAAVRAKASRTSATPAAPIRTAFHGQAPEVTIRAPRKVSSATDGGCATAMTNGIQPTLATQASAPGSHSSARCRNDPHRRGGRLSPATHRGPPA